MKIEITTKNYHLDDYLNDLIIKKINRFDKYFSDNVSAKVKLSTHKDEEIMEISICTDRDVVRSESSSDRMGDNLDVILPKLERQILKNKDRFRSRLKKTAFDAPILFEETEKEATKLPKVVKVKKFDVSVCTVENAVEEMELLNHSFYVFINGETNKMCVLYRRNDGELGLIEPEY